MDDLLAARLQMAISLGFHILFAVAGMAMPILMVIAEWRHQREGDPVYRELARRWATGTAILFAVGAVSGTVLSFELGLLWPAFMQQAGPLIGMPFSLEGFAFFLEAIALGIYLYGWDRVPARVHLLSGIVVALSGLASGVFVMAVNAWMNTPRGFVVGPDGTLQVVDLMQAFFTPAFPSEACHMALAAYASVGFAVLGIHAARLLREPGSRFHAAAARIVLPLVVLVMPLQLLSGDFAAKHVARHQPAKLAAAEGLFRSQHGAPLALGGIPDSSRGELRYALHLPKLLSVLAHGDPQAEVIGLDRVSRSDWPNVMLVHAAFQVMVACGSVMLGLALWGGVLWLRRRELWRQRAFLRAAKWCAPLGMIALEAGWIVTETGRQPWIIQGVMRVHQALTKMPGLSVSLAVTCGIYAALGTVVAVLLYREVHAPPQARRSTP